MATNNGDNMDKNDGDTYSYRGWLVSDKLWKRLFAFAGYSVASSIVAWGMIIFLLIVLLFIAGAVAGLVAAFTA